LTCVPVDWIAHRGVSKCVAFVHIKEILIGLGGGGRFLALLHQLVTSSWWDLRWDLGLSFACLFRVRFYSCYAIWQHAFCQCIMHIRNTTFFSRNKAHAYFKAKFDRTNRPTKTWLYCVKLVSLNLYWNIFFNDTNFIPIFFIYLE
jgi:hypothetical protein